MIIPVFKPFGASTHRLAQRVGEWCGEKATHTGTLDPAAQGVVVVLTGDDRFQKENLANCTKIYQATLLLGVSTDTHDMIGLPREVCETYPFVDRESCISRLNDLLGTYQQELPRFSAKRIDGKSYFDLARSNATFQPATDSVTIESIELLSSIEVTILELSHYFTSKVDQIVGDFRQHEIKKRWFNVLTQLTRAHITSLPTFTLNITCSKRTYIRALVRDFSQNTGIPAVLYSLTRTANGPYSIKDCMCLI